MLLVHSTCSLLQEAKDWIGDKKDITPEKFLTVLLNVEGPEASCGHIPDIQNITETVFDSYAFSPSDKKQVSTLISGM